MRKILILTLAITASALPVTLPGGEALAQTAYVVVSWRAESLAPASYPGKVFPTEGSEITAAFEFFRNGKPADLSKKRIVWLADGVVVADGINRKSVSFRNPSRAGDSVQLEIRIVEANGAITSHTETIPVRKPEIAIRAPYSRASLGARSIELSAIPYFWNLKDAADIFYRWAVNNVAAEGDVADPQNIEIEVTPDAFPGSEILVEVVAQNKNSEVDIVRQNILFITK